jgi:hypothetical protein
VKSSDYHFGNIDKGITPNPYENASISDFQPANPWTAPAAYADIIMEPFPTLSQMDAEYDSWPESGNPFSHDETAFASGQRNKAPVSTTGYQTLLALIKLQHSRHHCNCYQRSLPPLVSSLNLSQTS